MSENTTAMVEARSLRKDYGSHRAVVDVSFKVFGGEVVGFLGPNGAGKTTTMKMLTGYLKATAGSAFIGGIDVSEDAKSARRLLGYLPENAPLYDDMLVIDFLEFVADLRGVDKAVKRERLRTICERCGLMEVLGKDIGQLSKGYRQRVGLAQAMVHNPPLLILDEPTSGLDPNQIVEIRQLIKDLGREKTVILSTHILPEVQATCDRIIIINDGRLVADDSPKGLSETDTGTVIHLLVKGNGADRQKVQAALSGVPGVRSADLHDGEGEGTWGFRLRAAGNADPREAIFNTMVSNHWVLLGIQRERVSLEDTFRRLTRGEAGGKAGGKAKNSSKQENAHA